MENERTYQRLEMLLLVFPSRSVRENEGSCEGLKVAKSDHVRLSFTATRLQSKRPGVGAVCRSHVSNYPARVV